MHMPKLIEMYTEMKVIKCVYLNEMCKSTVYIFIYYISIV